MASGTGEVHTKQLTPDMHDYDIYLQSEAVQQYLKRRTL